MITPSSAHIDLRVTRIEALHLSGSGVQVYAEEGLHGQSIAFVADIDVDIRVGDTIQVNITLPSLESRIAEAVS